MFLSKRSNGIYYIFYVNGDGKRTSISAKTKLKSEALKFLSNFHTELKERGKSKVIPINLKQFKWNYLKYSESIHSWKTTKTIKTTFNMLELHFGNISLIELSTSKLSDYFQKRITESSIYAARRDYINLSAALNKAIQDKYLIENPLKRIKRFRIPEKQPLFFSEKEFDVLMKNIDDILWRHLIVFAVNTGLRQMELITLEWNQINLTCPM